MRLNRTEAKAGGKNSCCIPDPPPHLMVHWTKRPQQWTLFFPFLLMAFPFAQKWIPLIFIDFSQSVAKIFYNFFFFRLLINHNISNLSRHLSQAKCILGSKHPPTLYIHMWVVSQCGVNWATLSSWANVTNDLSFALRAKMSYGCDCLWNWNRLGNAPNALQGVGY